MNRLFKLLTLLLFYSITAAASDPVTVFSDSRLFKWAGYSEKKYEDVRIDSNSDGLIDYWKISNGNLKIEINFIKNTAVKYNIKKFESTNVTEISYRLMNGKLRLAKATKRPQQRFGYSEESAGAGCNPSQSQKNAGEISALESAITADAAKNAASNLLDAQCMSLYPRGKYSIISDAVFSYLTGSKAPTDLRECLSSDSLVPFLDKKVENPGEFTAKLQANYALEIKRLVADPKSHAPLITCEASSSDEETEPLTMEDGRIIFRAKEMPSKEQVEIKLRHEMFHRLGVETEAQIHDIENICSKISRGLKPSENTESATTSESKVYVAAAGVETALQSNVASSSANDVSKASTTQDPKLNTDAATAVASRSTASIPPELTGAQIGVNKIAETPVNITPDRGATPEQVKAASVKATSAPIKFANSLMGAVNVAEAAPRRVERGVASTSTSSPRETASARISSAGPSESAAKVLARNSSNGLRRGERIVEEITLDKNNASPEALKARTSGGARGGQEVTRATTERTAPNARGPANVPAATVAQPSETRSAPSLGASLSSAPSAGVSSGTSSTRTAIARRRPTNSQQGSAGNARGPANVAGPSREEFVTYFRSAPYSNVKQRLNDPKFNSELASQDITIVNRSGQSWGASDGSVIFEDRGDRFVQQPK